MYYVKMLGENHEEVFCSTSPPWVSFASFECVFEEGM
jgi:hypothetical protein